MFQYFENFENIESFKITISFVLLIILMLPNE
jgi:hypothetical protein